MQSLRSSRGGRRHPGPGLRVAQNLDQRLGQVLDGSVGDDPTVHPVLDQLRGAVVDVVGDHGGPRGKALGDRKPESLPARGHERDRSACEDLDGVLREAGEGNGISCQPQLAAQLEEVLRLRPATVDVELQAGNGPWAIATALIAWSTRFTASRPTELDHPQRITLGHEVGCDGVDHVRDDVDLEPGEVLSAGPPPGGG